MPTLFDPITLGDITCPNRILMAPLTRSRSSADGIPDPIKADYYAQRASAGLIISEATGISREGLGWAGAPGIWSAEQVEAWKPIVGAVHDAGGRIICQLWHMGRICHSEVTGTGQPISSSATTAPGQIRDKNGVKIPYEEARPLPVNEIPRLLGDYATAARNALVAGFDGVQLHSANGYLLDQFLRDNSNFRDDDYGGTVENRIRLTVEVMKALIAECGSGKVSIRLSPNGDSQGADDSNPGALFGALAEALDILNIGFLELREMKPDGTFGATEVPKQSPLIRTKFTGNLVLNQELSVAEAGDLLENGRADAISFGRPFISNPDLVDRIQRDIDWAESNVRTWYSNGPEGYTDYPAAA